MKSITFMKIIKSQFCEWLITQNRLQESGFKEWLFKPGMLFNDMTKWWQDGTLRLRPHEGVDFCCGINGEDDVVYLLAGANIPALYAGKVVRIFPDFLGQSIMVAHDYEKKGRQLTSIYAHTKPRPGLKVGQKVKAGDLLAMIATGRQNGIKAHLHLSTCWAAESQMTQIDWQTVNDKQAAWLSNPMDYLK